MLSLIWDIYWYFHVKWCSLCKEHEETYTFRDLLTRHAPE